MTPISRINRVGLLRYGGLVVLCLAAAGCKRDEEIKVQQVPKDSDSTAQQMAQPQAAPEIAANPHAGMDMGGGAAQPQLKWTLPGNWQEKPLTQFRAASFDAKGKDGQVADVSIIPLPSGGPEMELATLNMWRSEMQLPPAQKVDSQPVSIGAAQGKLYEVLGDKTSGRIEAAVLERGGTSWYFKLTGKDAAVLDQKPAFLDFLKSVSFESAPQMAATDPHAGTTPSTPQAVSEASNGQLPAGWKEVPGGAFLLAKYEIAGSGDAKAEVNVAVLGTSGGGMMANITRWRGQLGLAPLSEEDFSKQARTVDVMGGKGTLMDMTGTDGKTGLKARLIGVIAPQGSETWFYKLMGDEQIVGQQQDAFLKFIQTAKVSNAP